jgi:hypothetical protein
VSRISDFDAAANRPQAPRTASPLRGPRFVRSRPGRSRVVKHDRDVDLGRLAQNVSSATHSYQPSTSRCARRCTMPRRTLPRARQVVERGERRAPARTAPPYTWACYGGTDRDASYATRSPRAVATATDHQHARRSGAASSASASCRTPVFECRTCC